MAWGGGLTGLGQLMSVGAGLGKAYQDYQEQQQRQRRDQLILEEFRQRQADEKRKNDMMAGLFAAAGKLPMAQSPQAGMSPGAAALSTPGEMPATSPPPMMASAPPPSPSFSGSAGGGGTSAGGSVGRDTGYGGIPTVGPNARFPALPPNTTNDPGTPGPGYPAAPTSPTPDASRMRSGPNDNMVAQLNAGKPTQIADASGSAGFMTQMAQQGGNPQKAQGAALSIYPRIPQQFRGSMTGPQLVDAINQAVPDADGATKGMIFQHLSQFADHQTQQEWEQYKFGAGQQEKREEFRERQADRQLARDDTREYRRESLDLRRDQIAGQQDSRQSKDQEVFRDKEGNLHYMRKGEQIPEGWTRDNRRYYGAQSMALQTFMDEFTRDNGRPPGSQDIRNWQAANTMQTSEARSVGSRAGLLETAANSAEALIPLLVEKSNQINRTEFPTINKLILAYNEQTGDPNVVQYGEMINSMRYLYARAMSPTGQARVADLANFDAIMNKAWTQGQIKGGVDQIVKSLGAERQGLERTRQGVVGRGTQPGGQTPAQPTQPQPSGEEVIQNGWRYDAKTHQPLGPAQ